jgi:hypothetical protein
VSASAAACVARLLGEYRPATVLLIGDAPAVGTDVTTLPAEAAAAGLADAGRFDFAVVAQLTEIHDADTARVILGRLKNLHTDRFLLLADPARSCLDRDALLSLALAPLAHLEDGRVAWLYDIDRYNPERDWNTPADWANPENFDRFRW